MVGGSDSVTTSAATARVGSCCTLFSNRKKDLHKVVAIVSKWLAERGLRLKANWQIFRTRKRLPDALGYRYGHRYTLIRKTRLLNIKRQIRSYYRQGKRVSAKFAMALLSRLSGLIHCSNQSIRERFVPNGLQRNLKGIVREYQRKELTEWSTYLEQYTTAA